MTKNVVKTENELYKDKLGFLFNQLVPIVGTSEYIAGELVRATNHIGYRFYNDGDHIGVDYGNETCNPAAKFLSTYGNKDIQNIIDNMWEETDKEKYDQLLNQLIKATVDYVDSTPSLRTEVVPCDMWDFANKQENSWTDSWIDSWTDYDCDDNEDYNEESFYDEDNSYAYA